MDGIVSAQSEIPAETIEAYRTTDYRFGQGVDRITLRIDTRSDALSRLYLSSHSACGVFITAFNPYSQARNLEANEAAHARLGDELEGLARGRVIEGAGTDSTGEWPEEKSYFALGVDLETARRIGNEYRQNAIVWVGADAVPQLILLR